MSAIEKGIAGWPEYEIARIPSLNSEQESMLNMHSILNILNLLVGEIEVLGLRLNGQASLFERSLAACRRFAEAIRTSSAMAEGLNTAHAQADIISDELAALVTTFPRWAEQPEVRESCAAIESILGIFRIRTSELLLRGGRGLEWQPISGDEIQQRLLDVFSAIHTQSRGRHNFVFQGADNAAPAYLVMMRMESGGEPVFWMPLVFSDVIRDLVANARKYNSPGGRIVLEVRQCGTELEIVVTDNGRGIPDNEIARVVEFGYRASNALERRTFGGGFGLTKAVVAAKQSGGRMWIASRVGEGTRIRIVLPRPEVARGPARP